MMSNDDALTHQTRSTIHHMIVEKPGLTFTEIMNILKIKESTLRYHLRYLEKREIVERKDNSGRKVYFSSIEGSKKEYQKRLSGLQLKILNFIEQKSLCS